MTSGQRLALWQLREIESADDHALTIERIEEPSEATPWLWVTVSLLIGPLAFVEGGLRLRERETFFFAIPPQFPFHKPEVKVTHDRFAGRPHVQWIHHLCLYQSATEWNASDGIFGLVDRLEHWLRQGALNQLDPEGQPLHPPAVYVDFKDGKLFIPRKDTPNFEGPYWIGLAGIHILANRVEIENWFDLNNLPTQGEFAFAVLFGAPLPWEYPTKGAALFRECEHRGIPKEVLFHLLKVSTFLSPTENPLYFVFGSPMRGIAGGVRKQHLSVWAIEAKTTDLIRKTIEKTTDTAELAELRKELERILVEVLADAKITWCPVREDRPEVTIRRDHSSPLSYFHKKSVSIWGCGALGAQIALCLCRAGVRRLVLRDNATVTPGILVRQPYEYDDVGQWKVAALRTHLSAIRQVEIQVNTVNIELQLSTPDFDWSEGSDVVLDATASDLVRKRLEVAWHSDRSRRVPVASVMVDQNAKRLITAVVGAEFSGAHWDVFRRIKLETLRDQSLDSFANSFFPFEINRNLFQPEPGCSEPTFVGSAADSASLAAIGLNLVALELDRNSSESAITHLFEQPDNLANTDGRLSARFRFERDLVLVLGDHQVRISQAAIREMRAWIAQNRRLRNRKVETGGLLWGEWDDVTAIIWVTDASGPPPDSYHSKEQFRCGVEGTAAEHQSRTKMTRSSVGYIGMWHTHPDSQPLPSGTDIGGMHHILTNGTLPLRKNVLLIFGKDSGQDTIGVCVFRRVKGDALNATHEFRMGQLRLPEPT
jgi:integrative and conjugative element protein (TIGR02256 family)